MDICIIPLMSALPILAFSKYLSEGLQENQVDIMRTVGGLDRGTKFDRLIKSEFDRLPKVKCLWIKQKLLKMMANRFKASK